MSVLTVANIHFNTVGSERIELINGNVRLFTAGNFYINDVIAGSGTGSGNAGDAFDKANAANVLAFNTGIGANAFAAGVGSNANLFASATIAGANTAVGTGANTFASGVGANANLFSSATIAGANIAVGGGANSFAAGVGSNANLFASATIAGANTAVGGGANAFAAGVGSNANLFASATIAGANTAVGTGANSVGIAAFSRANASVNVINIAVTGGGFVNLTSNSTQINVVASNGVSLNANAYASSVTLNIGLTTTGVTATTYGATDTIIPRITVDPYGRITSASNVTVTNAASVLIVAQAAFAQTNIAQANVNFVNTAMQAAFAKANGAVQLGYTTVAAGGQNLVPSSNADTLTIANSNGISIVSITGASDSINIGLTTTGVTATTYGSSTVVPVLAVDPYGRVTSVANVAISGGSATDTVARDRANASVNVINIAVTSGGFVNLTSNSTQINVVASNGISLNANNYASSVRLNIGLTTTGVTATTYGSATVVPVITVDPYGRITSASNVAVSGGGGGGGYVTSTITIGANTTAVKSTLYVLTTHSLGLTLPLSPANADFVIVSNLSNSVNCIINRNGQNIMGLAENMVVDSIGASFTLIYSGATYGWVVM